MLSEDAAGRVQERRRHRFSLTDEELGRFSKETRELVTAMVTGDFG